jgi:hypothetical protein
MGFRRAARIDDNQNEIVEEFRARGASVKVVSQVKGFVDIVVGYRGHNFLIEIKDGRKPPSARKLTDDEIEFHASWRGTCQVIEGRDEVGSFLKKVEKTYGRATF